MNYDFIVRSKDTKTEILNSLNVLVPITDDYVLGFICRQLEYGIYDLRIYLENNGEITKIYQEKYHGYNADKIKKLLVSTDDRYWNFGLEGYRNEERNGETNPTNEDSDAAYIRQLKKSITPINGKKYAKEYYTFNERRELRKLNYYNYCWDPDNSYTLFEYLLARASNREKMSFKKIKLITLGYKEYEEKISSNVLYYSEYFLSDDIIEKIHELSLLDANTSKQLVDIKKMIEEEQEEFNRICEITANKKQENINTILETEKIKYMISNGISLQEAFYYIDKDAQNMKQNILNCYLSIENKTENLEFEEKTIRIAKYLSENVEKRYVETVIDHVLINDDSLDMSNLSDDILNHISFLKLELRGGKNVEN